MIVTAGQAIFLKLQGTVDNQEVQKHLISNLSSPL